MKAGLSRFINYCTREGIAPTAACDAVFDRFLDHLEADTLVPSHTTAIGVPAGCGTKRFKKCLVGHGSGSAYRILGQFVVPCH